MSLEVRRLDSIESVNENQWNNVVEQSEHGCAYHRYGWLRAVERGTGRDPRHLLVSKKDNPVAVLPNFVTELGPVSQLTSIKPGYGGPIAMTDEAAALELLLDELADLCSGRILFNAFRTYDQSYVGYQDVLSERGYEVTVLSCRFTLDLTRGWDALFADMDGERRRDIRRGNDQSVEVVSEPITEESLAEFYDDYVRVMDRVGMPTLPRPFVLELASLEGRIELFSLRVDGAHAGSYLYLLDEEQSTLQHLFTAVTEDHFEFHAPALLHEHAIKWGIDEGYETYELRGSAPDFRTGVYRFKSQFGANAIPLLVWERGRPAPALSALRAGRSIYRRYLQ
ncbi:GNAT family N-acetyltransferase [Halovivax limisalsi]|uniref:GNAT family N-acetyltransferase n=1 Tax=Halovivax limisalsi TaxID=1453760 RepID=UPI001FFD45B7|nr:GNAT family N-acetyltransferase [Halovivax limisalsi]